MLNRVNTPLCRDRADDGRRQNAFAHPGSFLIWDELEWRIVDTAVRHPNVFSGGFSLELGVRFLRLEPPLRVFVRDMRVMW